MNKIIFGGIAFLVAMIMTIGLIPAQAANSVSATNLYGGSVQPAWYVLAASAPAAAGDNIMVNTSASAVTVTLPASAPYNTVTMEDYSSSFNTHNLTINSASGVNLNSGSGSPASAVISTNGAMVECTYVDVTVGYRCHTF
jgi:hypothetical protein